MNCFINIKKYKTKVLIKIIVDDNSKIAIIY